MKHFFKLCKGLFLFFFAILFLLEGVSARVSDVGVEYDNGLTAKFLVSKWVPVMVRVRDNTNITINYKKDSVEIQTAKDNQKIS